MKKIAMVVWNEFLNDARVLKEAETLQAAGYKVAVYALHTPGVTKSYEVLPSEVEVFRTARSPFWRLRSRFVKSGDANLSAKNPIVPKQLTGWRLSLMMIARVWTHCLLVVRLTLSRADVIHAHDVNVLPTAWLAAKFGRCALIYDAHEISTSREGYRAFRRLVGSIEKYLIPGVDGMITTTTARAKYFARAYSVPRPVVLQNRPRFSRYPRSNRIREKISAEGERPIIVYQGGLQSGRGLKLLIDAAKSVSEAEFVFIGGGRLERELYQYAENCGVGRRVHFIPKLSLEELLYFTASADIGVQPIENTCLNHYTTDSNKLFEYVMAELPIVASDLPEIRKVVNQGRLGELVEVGNVAALSSALKKLVESPSLRKMYARNAENVKSDFCWEAQEELLVNLYHKIFAS